MSKTKKLKRTATLLLGAIFVIILLYFVQVTTGIAATINNEGLHPYNWDAVAITLWVLGTIVYVSSALIAVSLLLSIRKEESPMNQKTVRKIKILSMFLISFEVLNFMQQRLSPIVVFEGYIEELYTMITVSVGFGGFMIIFGFITYCVALMLEYGITLQEQVDETL